MGNAYTGVPHRDFEPLTWQACRKACPTSTNVYGNVWRCAPFAHDHHGPTVEVVQAVTVPRPAPRRPGEVRRVKPTASGWLPAYARTPDYYRAQPRTIDLTGARWCA
jgi:hypothetical protein